MNFLKKLFRKRKVEVKKELDKNRHHCFTCGACLGTGIINTHKEMQICPYCGGSNYSSDEKE